MSCSSSHTELTNQYIPGGASTVLMNKWSSRYVGDICDNTGMGRWSGMKLRINDESNWHYLTVYRVCNQRVKANNSLSTYKQQYIFMQEQGLETPNPRKQILLTLKSI
jgi:hypothetical protein